MKGKYVFHLRKENQFMNFMRAKIFTKRRIQFYEILQKIRHFPNNLRLCHVNYYFQNAMSMISGHQIMFFHHQILFCCPSKSSSKYICEWLIVSSLQFFIFESVKMMFKKLLFNKEMGWCLKLSMTMLSKLKPDLH